MIKIIWIKAKCLNYYNFIDKIKYLQLDILKIKYENNNIYLKIYAKDFPKIKKYILNYKFEIVRNNGIYYMLDNIKKNHILILMLILGLILYFVFINLVLSIDIICDKLETRELLQDELYERGIRVLSFKKNYQELNKIKKDILNKYPDKLDWLEIESKGMKYIVRLEERILETNPIINEYCDIIAIKDGIITNIKMSNGDLVVGINDYVRKGDLLIRGNVLYNNEVKRYTCAQGDIFAEVWYMTNVSIPLEHYETVKTGKKKSNLVLDINGNKKRLLKKRFTNFDSSYKLLLKIFNIKIFLEYEYESKKMIKKYSLDEALQVAIDKSSQNIKLKTNNGKIINKKVLKKEINNSTMDVEIFITTEEIISNCIKKEYELNDIKSNKGSY